MKYEYRIEIQNSGSGWMQFEDDFDDELEALDKIDYLRDFYTRCTFRLMSRALPEWEEIQCSR